MFLIQLFANNVLNLLVDLVLLAGVIGLLLSYFCFFIPLLVPYKPTIKLVSIILLIVGAYGKGLQSSDADWKQKVSEVEAKLKIAEEKSKQVNVRVETQVIEKVKIIKEKVHENRKAIQKHKVEIDAECKLPDVARVLYNRAITHEVPGSTANTNATSARSKAFKPE